MLKKPTGTPSSSRCVKDTPVRARPRPGPGDVPQQPGRDRLPQRHLHPPRRGPLRRLGARRLRELPLPRLAVRREGACVKIPAARPTCPSPRRPGGHLPGGRALRLRLAFLGDLPRPSARPCRVLPRLDPSRAPGRRLSDDRPASSLEGQLRAGARERRRRGPRPVRARRQLRQPGPARGARALDLRGLPTTAATCARSTPSHLDPPEPQGIWKYLRKRRRAAPRAHRVGILFPNDLPARSTCRSGPDAVLAAHVPIDETTPSRSGRGRDFFTQPWAVSLLRADQDSYRRTMKIFYEDQPTVEGQRPELIPVDLSAELQVKSDAVQLAYRRWRLEAFNRGWGMTSTCGPRARDQGARVIPSPAAGSTRSWPTPGCSRRSSPTGPARTGRRRGRSER